MREIIVELHDKEYVVTGQYYSKQLDTYYYPGDVAEFVIVSITLDGKEIKLSDNDIEHCRIVCLEKCEI